MEYIDESVYTPVNEHRIGSIFKFETFVSLVLLIVTLLSFKSMISEYLSGAEETRFAPIKFFMLAISCISFLILLINGVRINKNNLFLWFAVFYVFAAVFATFFSGLYAISALPFKFIRLSYWVWVLVVSYYSVLYLNTLKYHIAIVIVFLPLLFFMFYRMMSTGISGGDSMLLLNAVFYLSFLLPVVLLLRSKTLKITCVLLVFAAILMSYKRSALFAFITSIPVFFYARITISTSSKFKKYIPILFGGTILLFLFIFSFNYISGAFGLDWAGRLGGMSADRGSGRLDRYLGYINILRSQSFSEWLLGHGYAATTYGIYESVHNDFLEVLYDFGLIGLIFYLLFIGQLVKIFFDMKKYKYRHLDAFAVSLMLFFWGSMFSMLVLLPYWFLDLAFFWGWIIADFHNAKWHGDVGKIVDPFCNYIDYGSNHEEYT